MSTSRCWRAYFQAVYHFGLIVANRASHAVTPALATMDSYAWLADLLQA